MGADLGEVDNYPEVSFKNDIAPLFRNSCLLSGCHGENPAVSTFSVPAGLNATPADIEAAIKNAKASDNSLLISPGKPSKSRIVIRALAEENRMPPLSQLPIKQRNDLNFWVAQGAKY